MASAGRILIMPKGDYDSKAVYENLDLVFHGGKSWVAKREVTGIEPTETNSEYWFKLCEGFDPTEFSNRNVLDYENKVVKNHSSLPYTCPSAGEVTVYIEISGTSGYLKIDKNGLPTAYLSCGNSGSPYLASTFPVAKGDVISRNGSAGNIGTNSITFIPYKYQ